MVNEASPLTSLSILVLEDEPLLRKQVAAYFERLGADVTAVDTVKKARQLAADLSFDFALLDVNLPDGAGLDLLQDKVFSQNTGVIMMTAQGGVDGAIQAMKLGALDYLNKPFDMAELPLIINRVRKARQNDRIDEHKRKSEPGDDFLFGASLASMRSQLDKIIAADTRVETHLAPILIEGETGTGKTTIARWIHHHGPRAKGPLIEVNCSALPETLVESELFGHEKGAFTDARSARIGLFEAGHGGTLFLDELPSLSLPLQAKVLTAIEDHKIRRVGGNKEIPVDVRIIAATNQQLPKLISESKFREDLYHRLDLFRLAIPPLRQRGEDVLRLADFFLEKQSKRHHLGGRSISMLGKKNLQSYHWPGNVRELSHEVERAVVFEEGPALDFQNLAQRKTSVYPASSEDSAGEDWFRDRFVFPPEGFSLEEAIMRIIQHALRQTNDNVSAAARLLGVSRDYLRYRLSGKGEESGPASSAEA
jgi:DNA-binding NtrC family response regulator